MTLYDTLGVPRDADADAIKKAYRRLAREWHPDRNKSPGAEERFKAVNAANEVLSDPARRALYDRYGEASLQQGFDPDAFERATSRGGFGHQGFDVDDLLSGLFGRQGPPRPRELHATLELDFWGAVEGGERQLTFADGNTLRVRIPAGVKDGGRLRLAGRGPRGEDVVLGLVVLPDPQFTREADDLHARVEVTIGTALLGGRVSLDSPRGRTWLRVPEGSQNGQVLRLRGKGVAGRGDLFVTLDVRLPTHLDDAAREAVRVLEAAYSRPSETVAA